MDKRYQVFVSSTYKDLIEERREVMQALLELDHIPAGMELFPASDDDSWTLIRRVIDDCDYYIVIVGGRYGSSGPGGVGYTEKEYRYAIDARKPVIAFLHKDPEQIPAGKSEQNEISREALRRFRALCEEKQCRYWATPSELGSMVSRSLIKLVKEKPGVGWVRGNSVLSTEGERELLELRAEVSKLRQEAAGTTNAAGSVDDFAQGLDEFDYLYNFVWKQEASTGYLITTKPLTRTMRFTTSWDDVFRAIGPAMLDEASTSDIRQRLDSWLTQVRKVSSKAEMGWDDAEHSDGRCVTLRDTFDIVLVQLRALKLIEKSLRTRSVSDKLTYFALTGAGDTHLTRLLAVRREAKFARTGSDLQRDRMAASSPVGDARGARRESQKPKKKRRKGKRPAR